MWVTSQAKVIDNGLTHAVRGTDPCHRCRWRNLCPCQDHGLVTATISLFRAGCEPRPWWKWPRGWWFSWTARSCRRRISGTRRAFRRQPGVALYDLCVVFVEFEKLLYLFTGGDLRLVGLFPNLPQNLLAMSLHKVCRPGFSKRGRGRGPAPQGGGTRGGGWLGILCYFGWDQLSDSILPSMALLMYPWRRPLVSSKSQVSKMYSTL